MLPERQSAEWGVRAIKGPFRRLTIVLLCNTHTRFKIIAISTHLYNFRTHGVGLNQLNTVYASDGSDTQPWVREIK